MAAIDYFREIWKHRLKRIALISTMVLVFWTALRPRAVSDNSHHRTDAQRDTVIGGVLDGAADVDSDDRPLQTAQPHDLSSQQQQQQQQQQQPEAVFWRPGHLIERRSTPLSFLLYVPPSHGQGSLHWPLVIFLHGAGEMGGELDLLLSEGATGCPPQLVASRKDGVTSALTERFVLAAPQTSMGWEVEASQGSVASIIEQLLAEPRLALDPDRVYLTGVSMGGAGTWQVAAANPELFAAVAPVCGYGVPSTAAAVAARLPIWAFHGANDVIVPVDGSRSMILAARQIQGAIVEYTEFAESPAPVGWPSYIGHASWIQAYNGSALWDWFLSRQRPFKA